jgi:hypothetical protein
MDVFEAVRTLFVVRSCQDKSVPDAVVRRIVEPRRISLLVCASARFRW